MTTDRKVIHLTKPIEDAQVPQMAANLIDLGYQAALARTAAKRALEAFDELMFDGTVLRLDALKMLKRESRIASETFDNLNINATLVILEHEKNEE